MFRWLAIAELQQKVYTTHPGTIKRYSKGQQLQLKSFRTCQWHWKESLWKLQHVAALSRTGNCKSSCQVSFWADWHSSHQISGSVQPQIQKFLILWSFLFPNLHWNHDVERTTWAKSPPRHCNVAFRSCFGFPPSGGPRMSSVMSCFPSNSGFRCQDSAFCSWVEWPPNKRSKMVEAKNVNGIVAIFLRMSTHLRN